MKWKSALCIAALAASTTGLAFASPNWNHYDSSMNYAPSSMHQGYFDVAYLPSISVDVYNPPIYVISVNEMRVTPEGKTAIGRTTYRFDYNTKQAWMLTKLETTTPEWVALPMNNAQQVKTLNKIFNKAYGIDFVK